jgi:hypothetical protein
MPALAPGGRAGATPADAPGARVAVGWAEMNATEWLAAFAAELGVDAPTKDELKAVLDLAGEAAHSSERIAAPVACWLAARAGAERPDALRIAKALGDE